jgi:hypothetical protein
MPLRLRRTEEGERGRPQITHHCAHAAELQHIEMSFSRAVRWYNALPRNRTICGVTRLYLLKNRAGASL